MTVHRRRLSPLLAAWIALAVPAVAGLGGLLLIERTGVGEPLVAVLITFPIFGALQLVIGLVYAVQTARRGSLGGAALVAVAALGIFAATVWWVRMFIAALDH